MPRSTKRLRSHAHVDTSASAVTAAMLLFVLMFVVEGSGVLPLQGQETPMYGSVQEASVSSAKKRNAAPKTPRSARSRSRKAATSSQKADAQTLLSNLLTKGDVACFAHAECEKLLTDCVDRTGKDTCQMHHRWVWAMHSFFPECLDAKDKAECATGALRLVSNDNPAPLRDCIENVMCRELLSTHRLGMFSCRKDIRCLEALETLFQQSYCKDAAWCRSMQSMHDIYTAKAGTCKDVDSASCRESIGIAGFATTKNRTRSCVQDDSSCGEEMKKSALYLGVRHTSVQDGSCFLLPECKQLYEYVMKETCKDPGMQANGSCDRFLRVYKLLTEAAPQCVAGPSKYCAEAIQRTREE